MERNESCGNLLFVVVVSKSSIMSFAWPKKWISKDVYCKLRGFLHFITRIEAFKGEKDLFQTFMSNIGNSVIKRKLRVTCNDLCL